MKQTLIQSIASKVDARQRCLEAHNLHWYEEHKIEGDELAEDHLPHGSGFDCGSKIDWDRSKAGRVVLFTEFHHMDENGCYDRWSEHDVIVTPSLVLGFNIRITGEDYKGIKDYIAEMFSECLSEEIVEGAQP